MLTNPDFLHCAQIRSLSLSLSIHITRNYARVYATGEILSRFACVLDSPFLVLFNLLNVMIHFNKFSELVPFIFGPILGDLLAL